MVSNFQERKLIVIRSGLVEVSGHFA